VDGELELAAGDVLVDVDGSAWISVEPAGGAARVGGPNPEEPMDRTNIAALAAGAVVTVAVYEGTAVVRAASGDAGEPVVIEAGQTRRIAPPTAGHDARAGASGAPQSAARQQQIQELERQLEEVQHALDEARFEGALTRGQLAALQGTPSEWPADVPEALTPARFRAELEAHLAGLPDVAVAEVDCAEYPCIAALHYTGPAAGDDWNQPLGSAARAWISEALGTENVSMSVNTSRFRDGEHEERYLLFGAHADGRDSDVGVRTEYRMDAMVDALGDQVRERAAGGAP
jgi:hypothetical protein